LDPGRPKAAVARARAAGIPVITFERPRFAVSASLVYPNYNQGVYLAEELANVLKPGAPVAVIGGPRVIDDEELLDGIIAGVQRCGLSLVNDPRRDEYRNNSDRRVGGQIVAAHVLEVHSQIAGLIPYNDETMLGALDALEDCGTARDIAIVSRNGVPEAIKAVTLGRTLGTWDIDPPGIGAAVGQLVIDTLREKVLPATVAIAPLGRFVCRDNVSDWQPWDQRVVHSRLRPW
jgi:ABC-type sugar transport system substrate-binding protein